jgi:hypothetical protein
MFEQDRVIVRLQQRVQRDPSIVLCYLAGSFGHGQADKYSDIDVVLAFRDESSRKIAFDSRRNFVQSVLPYVPAKSIDPLDQAPYAHIALYSNGALVEYKFETIANLQDQGLDAGIRLLKDTINFAPHHEMAGEKRGDNIRLPSIDSATLTAVDSRFWVLYIDVFRLLMRGDLVKAYPIYLDLLNNSIRKLLPMLPIGHTSRAGLIQLYFNLDGDTTLEQLKELLRAYLNARAEIVRKHNLTFVPDGPFERELLKVIGFA